MNTITEIKITPGLEVQKQLIDIYVIEALPRNVSSIIAILSKKVPVLKEVRRYLVQCNVRKA
jgi:hypothetical protein